MAPLLRLWYDENGFSLTTVAFLLGIVAAVGLAWCAYTGDMDSLTRLSRDLAGWVRSIARH